MRDLVLGPAVADHPDNRRRVRLSYFTHRTMQRLRTSLHAEFQVVLAQPLVLRQQPGQFLMLGLVQRSRAGLRGPAGPAHPRLQRALVHAQIPCDLRSRFPRLQHDPHRPLTKLGAVATPLPHPQLLSVTTPRYEGNHTLRDPLGAYAYLPKV